MSHFGLNLGQTAEDSDMFTNIWLSSKGLILFIIIIICMNISLSIFVLECFMPKRIFYFIFYNEYSYLLPVFTFVRLHVYGLCS